MISQHVSEHRGYTEVADWWSLGATIYKLYTGERPYVARNKQHDGGGKGPTRGMSVGAVTIDHALNAEGQDLSSAAYIVTDIFQHRQYLNMHAEDMLYGLLHFDEDQRLGSSNYGAKDIMNHLYYKSIDWAALEAKQLPPPPIPTYCKPEPIDSSSSNTNFSGLDAMLIALGHKDWLEEEIEEDEEAYFANWDFTSIHTTNEEIAASQEILLAEGPL